MRFKTRSVNYAVLETETSHHTVIQCPQTKALRHAMRRHWLLSDDEQLRYTGRDWLLLLLDRQMSEGATRPHPATLMEIVVECA